MKTFVNVKWDSNLKFKADLFGKELVLDAASDAGGNDEGFRPKSLMMVALAGCTGMDVISILKKMKVDVTYFNLRIEGNIRDEHPKKYESMKVIYEFKGNDLELEKLQKAVNLSIEKYCGVNANYRDSMQMEYEISIL
ncbi:MAG: OsmC family protein [Bacteroidota bacterium]|nr:OsmC family protein [Bacteroidota bacterium]